MRRKITAMAVALLCVLGLSAGAGKASAQARNNDKAAEEVFSGSVGMLKQEGGCYVMQVTVENGGEDFSGTVQLVFAGPSYKNSAYNTEITLPAQGRKQFTVNVTNRAVDNVRGVCALNFLDEKGSLLQSIKLKNVFGSLFSGISVGILSDDYQSLTYLDAGGRNLSVQGGSYPLQLHQLDADNLQSYLDGLFFLVIDQFNVSTLGEENILAIQEWVKAGGWLMIGTGAYGEQTLSGFEESFLAVEVKDISEPGEENLLSNGIQKYGYYYGYESAGVDFTDMAVAALDYSRLTTNYYENREIPCICSPVGDGAAAVFYMSLGEKGLQKLDSYTVHAMYEQIMFNSPIYQVSGYSEIDYMGKRCLAFIDNSNTELDFTLLEVLIGIYVVFAGPVLYFVLRKCKKSEWYWVGAPALGLVFIAGVFLIGQGARVNGARAYSVTVQRADSALADTFLLAYRSGTDEWKLLLNDSYETAGPGLDGYYRAYGSGGNVNDYYYAVTNDSRGLSVGIKPDQNFENGYLYARARTRSRGSFSGRDLSNFGIGPRTDGIVSNDTDCDFKYMAVMFNSTIMVLSDVKAGETVDLGQVAAERCVYKASVPYFEDLLYNMVSIYTPYPNLPYERDDMAALLIGLGMAEDSKPTDKEYAVVVGLADNYDKAVADKCSELSYGCIYSYVEAD